MSVSYQFDKKRFEAFIDAIMAILLTILVLEIKIPEDKIESTSTYEQVKSLIPYIVSYFASFMLIVGFWIDYHLLFVNITNITKRFIILNMLFILSISFAPFVTAFAGKHYHDAFAVALLGATYFMMNFFFHAHFFIRKIEKPNRPIFLERQQGRGHLLSYWYCSNICCYSAGLCKHLYFFYYLSGYFRLALN